MRFLLLATMATLAATVVGSSTSAQTGAISLEYVDGAIGSDTIAPYTPINMYIRVNNNTGLQLVSVLNGFRVYGADSLGGYDPSVSWTPLTADTINGPFGSEFDLAFLINYQSVTGTGADTIGFGGSIMMVWAWGNHNEVSYVISTELTDEHAGKMLCLDSSFCPPAIAWRWVTQFHDVVIPTWDGPHCFTIAECCRGMRGNIDNSTDEAITISDLVYLVSYMFGGGPAPVCMETADFYGDGSPDIADLVYLVDYMFNGGAPPPDCP